MLKKGIILLITAVMLMTAAAVCAESQETEKFFNEKGYVYTVKEDGIAEIAGYTGKDKKLSIPSELKGLKVTSIASHAFNGSQITEASVPEGVKAVGNNVFEWCPSLTKVVFPEGLEVLG